MYYKHNIHNRKQTSTVKLILPSYTNALNTARGLAWLYTNRKVALVQLHIKHDLGYREDNRNKLTVHNTTPTSQYNLSHFAQNSAQARTWPTRIKPPRT